MLWMRSTLIACALIAASNSLNASTIKIDGNEPRRSITVTIERETVESILKDFAETYGFGIKGLVKADKEELLSTTLSGSLAEILPRLLRNTNHVIVRSPDNRCGIDRVIIIGEGGSNGATLEKRYESESSRLDTQRRQYSAQDRD
jgi:hypothetical protein